MNVTAAILSDYFEWMFQDMDAECWKHTISTMREMHGMTQEERDLFMLDFLLDDSEVKH